MEFQGIKQQIAEISSHKTKPPVRHPTSRNSENFMNTKLSGKPKYTKKSKLTKDKKKKKQKGRPLPVISKYPERHMLFQVRPGAARYSEAIQQKKKIVIIRDDSRRQKDVGDRKMSVFRQWEHETGESMQRWVYT